MDIKNLPRDVIYNIMSFSCIEYKKAWLMVNDKIKLNNKINKLIIFLWDYNNKKSESHLSVEHFCSKMFSCKTLEKLLKKSNKCYCCTKHCHYRPTDMTCFNNHPDKVVPNQDDEKISTCSCTCRHLSRAYWKAYNYDYDYDYDYDS